MYVIIYLNTLDENNTKPSVYIENYVNHKLTF